MTIAAPIRPLVVGNWKMNGLMASLAEAREVAAALAGGRIRADVMICPPATLIASLAQAVMDGAARQATTHVLRVGGQDCHAGDHGAHTGDISAAMLADVGATSVILGHSERRADHGETSAVVRAKVEGAGRARLTSIVCIGETAGERSAGLTMHVVLRQLQGSLPDSVDPARTVVAYEPVWAIGTGLTASPDDVKTVHAWLRAALVERFGTAGHGVRILYGGSVKPANAAELMAVPNVNGALVGGASLKASDFLAILAAYHA